MKTEPQPVPARTTEQPVDKGPFLAFSDTLPILPGDLIGSHFASFWQPCYPRKSQRNQITT